MTRRTFVRAAALFAMAMTAQPAPAASEYRCGDGGKPNKATKACDCPAGKVEQTVKDVSRCVDAPKPPKPAPTATSKPPPAPTSTSTSTWQPPPPPPPVVTPLPPATLPKLPPGSCPAAMAFIPGGAYERKKKPVTVDYFCMDLTEVTVEAFAVCVAAGKCPEPHRYGVMDGTESQCNWKHVPPRDKHPITCVRYTEAEGYCAFVGKRLPTAIEFTWAYRGGDEARKYAWGNEPPSPAKVNACGKECVYYKKDEPHIVYDDSDPFAQTAPVASFPPTRWGLYDMAGNVEEWTSTIHWPPHPDRVALGGSWWDRSADDFLSDRPDDGRDQFDKTRGFRCAR